MKIHTYERAFLAAGAIVVTACGAALLYVTLGMGIHLPGAAGRVEPLQVLRTPPFNRPGLHQTGPDRYDAVILAQSWAFIPSEIRIPVGAEVTFIGTAIDIIHGLHVAESRVNMMLIPGQISRNTYRFERPGEFLLLCHEYCGLGHHTMSGKVIVEPARAASAAPAPEAQLAREGHHQ